MATIARPQEFLERFNKVLRGIKTSLNSVEAHNWIAAKTSCDQSDNAPDKVAYLEMLEKGLGKRKVALFNKLESICIEEIKYLINGYNSVNTVFPIISQYRNTLKKSDENHIALSFFKLPKEEYAKRRTTYRISVKQALGDKRPYYNESAMIKQACDLLQSDSYIAVAMGLCLLTGRRPSEILHSAKFTEIKGIRHVIAFSGQLKTKDSELARDSYLIPVLADSKIIIKALLKLRSMRDFKALEVPTGKTLSQVINSKTGKTQNDCVTRYFSEFLPAWVNNEGKKETVKPYNLRQCYLDIVFRKFVNGSIDLSVIPELKKDDKNMLCSNILGHSKDDLATVNSYMRVKYEGDL